MNHRRRDEKVPAFFNVFFPEMSTNRLKIPSAFTSYMQGKLPKRASLSDRNGKLWPVKLKKIENDFFFCEGWTKFVEDSSIRLREFLLFEFDGSSVFEVMLLGHNGCEKNLLAEREEEKEEDANQVKEEVEDWEKKDEETNVVEEEQDDSYRNATASYVEAKYIETEETITSKKTLVVGHSISSQKGLKMSSGGKQVGNGKAEAVKAVDRDCNDIFKSGSIPQPKNPYFVTQVRARGRDEVHVPLDFIKDNYSSLLPEIILRDPNGREWTSKLISWEDGRLWYCGGWGSLSGINLVNKDDTYICEFVKEDDGGFFIQVHIVYNNDFAQNQK